MGKEVNQSMIMKTLDWAYDKSITLKLPGMESALKLAEDYNAREGSLIEKVNSLIRWQDTMAGTSGFLTGLGGLITLPVAIPANISSVLFIQLRMIAAIAIMGGHDPQKDEVRTLAYVCLCGNAAKEVIQQASIQVGQKLSLSLLKKLPGAVLSKINKAVGFRLFTKFGQKGVLNLWKALPLMGGFIGATIDVVATNTIGNTARDIFIGERIGGPRKVPSKTINIPKKEIKAPLKPASSPKKNGKTKPKVVAIPRNRAKSTPTVLTKSKKQTKTGRS